MLYLCGMTRELTETVLTDDVIAIVAETAQKMGMETFVIGGYVRDLLLNRESKDIDFMTLGSGVSLATEVAHSLGVADRLVVFKNFGTAQFKLDGREYEFVGARKESYRANSRKPLVEDGTFEDDLKRRDFTINALAIPLTGPQRGDITDIFGGLKDLKLKRIVTPLEPGITFSDDPLRMMRAIRFATQLDFDIDESLIQAIRDQKSRISIVSRERISDELNKIILSHNPSRGIIALSETGLLELIFPEFERLRGVAYVEGKGHKDNFYHTLQVLDNMLPHTADLWLRWAALLHDIAKPATRRYEPGHGWTFHGHEELGARKVPSIFRRLGLPLNDKMKFVQKMVRLHLRPIALVKEEITDAAIRRLIYDAGDDLEALMTLCRADITTKNPLKVKRYLSNFDTVCEKLAEVEEKDRVRNYQPPIDGKEIMDWFGLPPGREVGLLKNASKEAILDGVISNDYHSAKEFILSEAMKMGLKPLINE
jgi:poly(A) polymerase